MTESDKPEGDIEDADSVSLDDKGNPEIDLERIEISEGDANEDSSE